MLKYYHIYNEIQKYRIGAISSDEGKKNTVVRVPFRRANDASSDGSTSSSADNSQLASFNDRWLPIEGDVSEMTS